MMKAIGLGLILGNICPRKIDVFLFRVCTHSVFVFHLLNLFSMYEVRTGDLILC